MAGNHIYYDFEYPEDDWSVEEEIELESVMSREDRVEEDRIGAEDEQAYDDEEYALIAEYEEAYHQELLEERRKIWERQQEMEAQVQK